MGSMENRSSGLDLVKYQLEFDLDLVLGKSSPNIVERALVMLARLNYQCLFIDFIMEVGHI